MEKTMWHRLPDYEVPLLRLLVEGDGDRRQVVERFYHRYSEHIPQSLIDDKNANGDPKWINRVNNAKQVLLNVGFVEVPTPGVWLITADAREWLTRNPDATHLPMAIRTGVRSITEPKSRRTSTVSQVAVAGVSFELLEKTKELMSVEQFRQIWGTIYDQLLAEERAKAITIMSDKALLDAVRKPVRHIQDFLQARSNEVAKSEEVCDWIHFCYTLGLYREGTALWQYVRQDEVNPWQYERTKKVATVCRTRISS